MYKAGEAMGVFKIKFVLSMVLVVPDYLSGRARQYKKKRIDIHGFRSLRKSLMDARVPALSGVQAYLAAGGCNQKGQVGEFVCFEINGFHDVNSLFVGS